MNKTSCFLFSVDLEDIRKTAETGEGVGERVPGLVAQYSEFLKKTGQKCTFFVVGETAREYPDLIKQLFYDGHEIACHTDSHIPLDRHSPHSFEADLMANAESIMKAGVPAPIGFRAPSLSLTLRTQWAYKILARNGFKYSSSVLPASNPLYGWKEFGEQSKKVDGILEIPVTLMPYSFLRLPMGAGIYFRVLPFFLIRRCFIDKKKKGEDVIGYFHPYDIDQHQPRIMHPGINNSRFYNYLMYYNRRKTLQRIEEVTRLGFKILRFDEYINSENLEIVAVNPG